MNSRTHASRWQPIYWFALLGVIISTLVSVPLPAQATNAAVTSSANDGPASFRAAVEQANSNPTVRTIRFAPGLEVTLTEPVVYTGSQDLTIEGHYGSVNGDGHKDEQWNGGLFVSTSDADITLRRITFDDSFSNGVAVFIPADATGTVRVSLDRVTITDSTLFGLLVDGQAYDGFNTDDVPHEHCVDPHFVDSSAGVRLWVSRSDVSNNGQLPAGYDLSAASGCPADFDGIRVDEGGSGGITAYIAFSTIDFNLADGVELDDVDSGSVIANVVNTSLVGNGKTPTDDQDDGLDIDEADHGSMEVRVVNVTATGNFDEAIDLDEAGPGDAYVTVIATNASGNVDEGLKVDEEDGGDLHLLVVASTLSDSEDDGIALEETGAGDLAGRIVNTQVKDNGKYGVKAEGSGSLVISNSDLSGNSDGPTEDDGVTITKINVIE